MPWSLQLDTYSQSDAVVKYHLLQHTRTLAVESNEKACQEYRTYYNKKASTRRFAIGDKILVHYPSPPPGINPKFYQPWKGVYLVDQAHGKDAYTVAKPGGRPTKVEAQRMKIMRLLIFLIRRWICLWSIPTRCWNFLPKCQSSWVISSHEQWGKR